MFFVDRECPAPRDWRVRGLSALDDRLELKGTSAGRGRTSHRAGAVGLEFVSSVMRWGLSQPEVGAWPPCRPFGFQCRPELCSRPRVCSIRCKSNTPCSVSLSFSRSLTLLTFCLNFIPAAQLKFYPLTSLTTSCLSFRSHVRCDSPPWETMTDPQNYLFFCFSH